MIDCSLNDRNEICHFQFNLDEMGLEIEPSRWPRWAIEVPKIDAEIRLGRLHILGYDFFNSLLGRLAENLTC